jgi:Zn-dependent protease
MKGSVQIGRLFGVPIRVHWSFSLLLLLVLYEGAHASRAALLWNLVWIVALFASVTLHELAHCAVAKRHGLSVRDIVLLPIGGVSEIGGMNAPPRVERDVAAAGPIASVALAVVLALAALVTGAHVWPPAIFTGSWFARLAWLNLLLAAFNLLPAIPMDGGRVFRAILSQHKSQLSATRAATIVAQVIGVGMIALGVFWDYWLVLIGLFVLLGAQSERGSATVRASLDGLRVRDVMLADPTTVSALLTVSQLAPWLWAFPGRAVAVVDGTSYIGVVANEDLAPADPSATVGSACDRDAPVLDPDAALFPDVLEAFSTHRRNQLIVLHDGQVVGVMYRSRLDAILRQPRGARTAKADARRAA